LCVEFKALFDYIIDARHRLLAGVAELTQEQFLRDMGTGWRSIRGTLVHMMDADDYWVSVLSGDEHKRYRPEEFPVTESIIQAWKRVEGRMRNFLEVLDEEVLREARSVTWDGETVHFTVAKALMHMATYETHHRGAVMGMIRQLGVQPPVLDLL